MKTTGKCQKILGDPTAYLFLKPFQAWSWLYTFICSAHTWLLARMKGISLASIPRCNGVPYLLRCPHSSIRVGRGFVINSSFKSNNVGMLSRSRITTNAKHSAIEIGDNVGMSAVTIAAFERITIGDNTLIGGNVLITDSDWHPTDPADRLAGREETIKTAPITIGRNVFIGTRAIILKGSVIGDNTVIGAGSVVSGEIPTNVIACGNPCKVIKRI